MNWPRGQLWEHSQKASLMPASVLMFDKKRTKENSVFKKNPSLEKDSLTEPVHTVNTVPVHIMASDLPSRAWARSLQWAF